MDFSPSIQAIDKKSVHQICSGQVILDLATGVKELIENSLDAGADNIEIKTKEYGKESIEVCDNGSGIESRNFETLSLKHYTSKLREFSDLTCVDTFGFRGEALSSLCALSDVVVTTRHDSVDVGSKLEFDHNGKLVNTSSTARACGTTVSVGNIFCTLPVRHKEFQRNYKKDFTKLVHVIYAYSLINCHVRFNCVNVVSKKKNLLLSTNGKKDVVGIIGSIFGPTQSKNIVAIQHDEMSDAVLEELGINQKLFEDFGKQFIVNGYVSTVTHGCGRSSPDRQFFFINKRPCDFSKLSRIVNEVYHIYNRNQYPFVFLDISLKKDCVDVNVTPDKRLIMIQQEKLLFAIVKNSLKVTFDKCATMFDENVENLEKSFYLHQNTAECSSDCKERIFSTPLVRKTSAANISNQSSPALSPLERFRSKFDRSVEKPEQHQQKYGKTDEQSKLGDFFQVKEKKRKFDGCRNEDKPLKKCLLSLEKESFIDEVSDGKISNNELNMEEKNSKKGLLMAEPTNLSVVIMEKEFDLSKKSLDTAVVQEQDIDKNNVDVSCQNNEELDPVLHGEEENENAGGKAVPDLQIDTKFKVVENESVIIENDDTAVDDKSNRNRVVVVFDFDDLKSCYDKHGAKQSDKKESDHDTPAFRAKIAPNESKVAEEELQKHISKGMFTQMTVLGQFNLGFIITKFKNDLFIVDQHASDEKYNFETLQRKQCLKGQRLIQPIPLELTLINRSILLDNIGIFKQNGFDFDISQNNKDSLKLTKVPTSRNWTFSVSDVEELIFMLNESPGVMCRPSRIRQMFASRACRSSVMVGTALDVQAMKKLLTHMSEIEHPWNCPHGRPTMRHLICLQRLSL